MSIKSSVLLSLIAFLYVHIVGCSSVSVQRVEAPSGILKSTQARVFIQKDVGTTNGEACKFNLYDNQKLIGVIGHKGYLQWDRPAGPMVLETQKKGLCFINGVKSKEFLLKAGEKYKFDWAQKLNQIHLISGELDMPYQEEPVIVAPMKKVQPQWSQSLNEIQSSTDSNEAKPVLVLFPIEVSTEDAELESEFGSSLQSGLQKRYDVFYGPSVETELEKEYSKLDCSVDSCTQNVAIAFNGELIADASAKIIGGGYALKLVIRNVITGNIVESVSLPCRGCDRFDVMDAFRAMGAK